MDGPTASHQQARQTAGLTLLSMILLSPFTSPRSTSRASGAIDDTPVGHTSIWTSNKWEGYGPRTVTSGLRADSNWCITGFKPAPRSHALCCGVLISNQLAPHKHAEVLYQGAVCLGGIAVYKAATGHPGYVHQAHLALLKFELDFNII